MDDKSLSQPGKRLWYVWDYDIDEETFQAMLDGKVTRGRLGRDWAAIRLLNYASYPEIVRRIGLPVLVQDWSRWRNKLRMVERRRGIDFVVEWLPHHHPEVFQENEQ
ncbi:MAG: hypothetical protein KJZ86_21580 [Caldilineaceae bacterium]|nr:hypothetical protein [Caldilineaceae bacterium]HRJ41421.1 hypothetical protein [Caldilineaceae bacterium]